MERDQRRDDRRRRDDPRDHKQRYGQRSSPPRCKNITNNLPERDRSRSPAARDRRDDRRRDRSPPRNAARPPPGPRTDRDPRGRDPESPPPPSRKAGGDNRARQAAAGPHTATNSKSGARQQQDTHMHNGVGGDEGEDSEKEMQRVMGFKDFRTTKDTKVPGNEKNYGVHKVKKTEYRQYMNRTGGFNRPLSPTRM